MRAQVHESMRARDWEKRSFLVLSCSRRSRALKLLLVVLLTTDDFGLARCNGLCRSDCGLSNASLRRRYAANAAVLVVENFNAFRHLQIANVNRVADLQRRNIDVDALRDVV